MSLPFRNQPFRVCPRCRAALPLQVLVCGRCGYVDETAYADRAGNRLERNQSLIDQRKPVGAQAQSQVLHSRTAERCDLKGASAPARPPKKRAALLYFVTSLFAVFILALAGLHGAHITPSMVENVFLRTNTPHKITYAPPQGTPLFADPLINDASGWNLQSSPANYLVAIGSSGLTLESDRHKLLWELLPGERSYSNFTLVVNAEMTKGDQNNGYGVYIRGTASQESDLATYYRFELYGDGSYAIFKGIVYASGASSAIKIAGYTLSPAIQKAGKVNHMMIVANGTSLELIVNGQLLMSIDDATYGAGSIALFVSNLPEARAGAQAQFSQLAIYPIGRFIGQ